MDKMPEEQVFFTDPTSDRLLGVIMALATEVYVLHDRQRALEQILEERGLINIADLSGEPTLEEQNENEIDRKNFVVGLMENLLGQQFSKGAPGSGL